MTQVTVTTIAYAMAKFGNGRKNHRHDGKLPQHIIAISFPGSSAAAWLFWNQ